jgi:hypothetical protein
MASKHALRPGGVKIPRVYPDHRGEKGRVYRGWALGQRELLGELPPAATHWLQQGGALAVELARLVEDLEKARARRAAKLAARIRKQLFVGREALGRIEQRLRELASARPQSPAERTEQQRKFLRGA